MNILDFNGAAWGIPAGGLHSASYCPPIVPAPAGTEPNPPADPLRRHNQVIPEAAAEAAAIAWVGRQVWQDCNPAWQADYKERARDILEAAAPHMLAEAWDEFVKGKWDPMQENPYRTTK